MSLSLLESCRKYEKSARRSKGNILSFFEFNEKYNTTLPTNLSSEEVYMQFHASVRKAKNRDGFPITGKLFNIYKRLSENKRATLNRQPLQTSVTIPPPTASLSPPEPRLVKKTEKQVFDIPPPKAKRMKKEPVRNVLEQYKLDLNNFLDINKESKLVGASQVVYFVPPEPVQEFENYSVKLTRSHGQILVDGGKFKMVNKVKRDIFGINKKDAEEVISAVTNGQKGPFFVSINCPTGAMNCECH
tara:strand:+ start:43 stop:777 length:735 start_codon:yes stop_codon:yes gene_type:complete